MSNVNGTAAVRVLAEDLEKPEIDRRSYRIIELSNQLEAILIHDETTDSASVALNVGVGSYTDTKEMPGIAHAIEHMITMGSEKFPAESHYAEYLTKYGGDSNAMTSGAWTCYFAQLNATKDGPNESADSSDRKSSPDESPLRGALDIFAQFFTHPLLTEGVVEREMKAVDSEHSKNKQADNWRSMQLDRSLSNKRHPRNCFATGNYKTLYENPRARGENPREAFIAWYKQHYSADRMKLAVLGRESLDQLQEWVSHFFSSIPNKALGRRDWGDIPVYGEDEVCTQVFVRSVQDIRSLAIRFPTPSQWNEWEYITDYYVAHVLGYEGKGSLLAHLKTLGWATSVHTGCVGSDQGEPTCNIDVGLTPDGWNHYQEVAKLVFQYLGMMRHQGPQARIFEELTVLNEINFRFRQNTSADDTVVNLSTVLQQPLDRKRFLKAAAVPTKYDTAKIDKLMECLVPRNARLIMTAQSQTVELDRVEDEYGVAYRCERIPEKFMQDLDNVYGQALQGRSTKEMHLPEKNIFVPENLEVEKPSSPPTGNPAPQLVRNKVGVRTWWKKDDTFLAPRAFINVRIRSSIFAASPFTQTAAELYLSLTDYMLTDFSYDAQIAGLGYENLVTNEGLVLVVEGYNDKLILLLERLITALQHLEFSRNDFDIVKNLFVEQLQNANFASAFLQGRRRRNFIMTEGSLLPEEQLEVLKQISEKDIRELPGYMFKQAHIEVVAYGNISRKEALEATDIVQSKLSPIPLPADFWPSRRQLELPAGIDHVHRCTSKDPDNKNMFIFYNLWVNDFADVEGRAKARLFDAMTGDALFEDLRTKKQLGYIVRSDLQTDRNPWCFIVVLQSLHEPQYLEEQIEEFLTGFEKTLDTMSSEDFEAHKTGLVGKLLRKMENMRQEMSRLSAPLSWRSLDFESNQTDAKAIRKLTKADIMSLYQQKIKPGSLHRTKLVVHLHAQRQNQEGAAASLPIKTGTSEADSPRTDPTAASSGAADGPESVGRVPRVVIDDVLTFRSSMKLAPSILPVKALKSFEAPEEKEDPLTRSVTEDMAKL